MIQSSTYLESADNTGAKKLFCISVLGGSGRKYAKLGDIVVVSVKEALPNSRVEKGDVHRAVIVRVRKEERRPDGTYVRFDNNAAVIVNKENEPVGTRVFGPIARELRIKGFMKIISLAPEVV